jgi:hypothetical protein
VVLPPPVVGVGVVVVDVVFLKESFEFEAPPSDNGGGALDGGARLDMVGVDASFSEEETKDDFEGVVVVVVVIVIFMLTVGIWNIEYRYYIYICIERICPTFNG